MSKRSLEFLQYARHTTSHYMASQYMASQPIRCGSASGRFAACIGLGMLLSFLWLFQAIGIPASATPASATTIPQTTLVHSATYSNSEASAAAHVTTATEAAIHELQMWRSWQELSPTIQAKVDGRILAELWGEVLPAHLGGDPAQQIVQPQKLTPREKTRFLVYLQEQPDLTQLHEMVFASQAAARTALLQSLQATAAAQQAPLRGLLEQRTLADQVSGYQPFFIVNAIAVEGDLATVIELAQRSDVARLVANYALVSVAPEESPANSEPTADATIVASDLAPANWNIDLVEADRVWTELGIRGKGAVVASFDTGVMYRHPALIQQYRGNLGNDRFDHNYNWFEPDGKLYANGDLGPSVSQTPGICSNHGTHTTGTMVGDGGTATSKIGMAPAAQWIALPGICNNTMSGGIHDDIGGLKAFQWLLCPTDLSGAMATADCTKAPDVINSSWGSANPVADLFRPIIRTLRAANIAPVFAAGNPFAGAGSIGTPANAPEAITVGATDRVDRVASFSGRGPSFYPGEQKPEFSAPGVRVLSAVGTNSYSLGSGTSMAAPHVAGLIALMVAADLQDGVRDYSIDEIENFMIRTAVDLGTAGADDDYGYGRIDAYAAVNAIMEAGDLRGTVVDAATGAPLGGVQVTGRSGSANFQAQTGVQGIYSLTVPAGIYDVAIRAWGYTNGDFPGQFVVAGSRSIADFALEPLPVVAVTGEVQGDAGAVADALVYVQAAPAVRTRTDATGNYTLQLPVGTHTLIFEQTGYHVEKQQIEVAAASPTAVIRNVTLAAAPTLLLVEADAYRGWFLGWPVDLFFRNALESYNYLYDQWPIQYPDTTDTIVLEDGSTGYGLPSLATLQQYEVVLWVQSGCQIGYFGCFFNNSPSGLGVAETLAAYMDGGGRIIFSGQDMGFWEDGSSLFADYLYTSLLADDAAGEGDALTGLGILEGLHLTITNASLYGHNNGIVSLAPDAIDAERPLVADDEQDPFAYNVGVYPILEYADSQLPAAIAVDACAADYRAIYFGVGYENIAQRADYRSPAIPATLDRSLTWVSGQRENLALELISAERMRFAPPGAMIEHEVRLVNGGKEALTLTLANETIAHNGSPWPVAIYHGREVLTAPIDLPPCQSVALTLRVAIPADASTGNQQALRVTLDVTDQAGAAQPALTRAVTLTNTAFASWQPASALATARHQLGVASVPTTAAEPTMLYAMGGWRNSRWQAGETEQGVALNSRFNSCTNQWESMSAMPAARAGMAMATLAGQIYVMGGGSQVRSYTAMKVRSHDNLWRYDPASDSWTELAALPLPLVGATAAALDGKIYLFGGLSIGYTIVEDFGLGELVGDIFNKRTYIYDPATDSWTTGTAIPEAERFFAAAVAVGNEIMVAGGWPNLDLVHFYNPATDSWRAGVPLRQGRHSFGLTTPQDQGGIVYAIGGGVEEQGIGTAEYFDPTTNDWKPMPTLLEKSLYGVAAAYAEGRIIAVGGAGTTRGHESLEVGDSFCLSTHQVESEAVALEEPVHYSVQLQGDLVDLSAATFRHPLPANTSFAGFSNNAIGATYDQETHAVGWQGAIPARTALAPIDYAVMADDSLLWATNNARAISAANVAPGTVLSSTAFFDNGAGVTFTRTTETLFLATDIAGSQKSVDQHQLRSGDQVTYTITIQGNNFINRLVHLRDPLPGAMAYVPDSLHYSTGSGSYNAATHAIEWQGETDRPTNAYINLTDNYQWGDSDGNGAMGPISYRWTEIEETGTAIGGGDYAYYCDLPIGFAFPFYDQTKTNFCVSTNGFISFDRTGHSGDLYNSCPLPDTRGNHSLIAVIWDDLVVQDSIYYQTLGAAPNRRLVVQWSDVRRYASFGGSLATFQAVLSEDGSIQFFIKDVGGLRSLSATTGLEDQTETKGTTYYCNTPGKLSQEQAIVFVPPNATVGVAQAKIQFRALAGGELEGQNEAGTSVQGVNGQRVNVPLTNTVFITLADKQIERQATTLLNPLDLSTSTFTTDRAELVPQAVVTYALALQNVGLVSADDATVTINLPAALAYEAGSLHCVSGICQQQTDGTLQWRGVITPQVPLTVTFAARLTTGLQDRTVLTTTALLADGFGKHYPLVAELIARRSDLSPSRLAFMPRFGEPGYTVVLVALLQNRGGLATASQATLTLPATLSYVEGSLACGTGSCTMTTDETAHRIQWQGQLAARQLVPIRLQVQIPPTASYGDTFAANLAFADVDWAERFTSDATLAVMDIVLLPTIAGDFRQTLLYLPIVIHTAPE